MKPFLSLILGCVLISATRAEELTERQKLAGQVVDAAIRAPADEAIFRKNISAKVEEVIVRLRLDEKSAATMREVMNESLKAVNTESITRMYRDSYAELFTPEELQGILAFYQTNAGKALLEKSKVLQSQIDLRQKELVKTMVMQTTEQMNQRAPEVMKKMQEEKK